MYASNAARPRAIAWAAAMAVAAAGLVASLPGPALRELARQPTPEAGAHPGLDRLPLHFEPNEGQIARRFGFAARGPGFSVALAPSGAATKRTAPGSGRVERMTLVGADDGAAAVPLRAAGATSSYILGGDPREWVTGVATYRSIAYEDVYPGIDIVYSGPQGRLRYDFVVAPGADPGSIGLRFSPAERLFVDGRGRLTVDTGSGVVRHDAPVAFQRHRGRRVAVDARFEVAGKRAGFVVGAYDPSLPLTIDPTARFASLLGGGFADSAAAVATAPDGGTVLVGQSASLDFPTAAPLQGELAGQTGTDAVVAKLNAAGTALEYSTYIGGTGTDRAFGLVLDGESPVVVGDTTSTDFPLQSAKQAAKGAGTTADAFVLKLNAAGSALTYSTYLGGGAADRANAVGLGDDGAAYVTGETSSTNFPTVAPVQAAKGAGTTADAFVTKVAPDGSDWLYSTYLGGGAADRGFGIGVTGDGAAVVSGETASDDFPTAAPLQAARADVDAGVTDAFVARIDSAGASLTYSTYLGGVGSDFAGGLRLDGSGRPHIAGGSSADNFPTQGPIQNARAGETDAIVSILKADGSGLDFSTYLGGRSSDQANAIDLRDGKVYVAGSTGSAGFPAKDEVAPKAGNSDAFVTRLDPVAKAIEFSTWYGGNASESGAALAVDGSGVMHLAGSSVFYADGDFPAEAPLQTGHAGGTDVLVGRLDAEPAAPVVTAIAPRSGPEDGGTLVTISGRGFAATTEVRFGSTPAAKFQIASPTKLSAISPPGAGRVDITVVSAAGISPANPASRYRYVDGIFRQSGAATEPRWAHTTTTLLDGRILVAGGRRSQGGPALASAEIYDPATRKWSATGSLGTARFAHTATLLEDGRVLVAGGFAEGLPTNAQPNLDSAETFDPETGLWTPAPSMSTAHALHAATRLDGPQCDGAGSPDWCGDVLVVSGRTWGASPPTGSFTDVTPVSEIFDVATGTWSTTGSVNTARHTTEAVVLDDGKVLVPAGFAGGATLASAELYDPATGTWSFTGSLSIPRARQGALKLPDGRVLAVGGFGGSTSAEIYDPGTATWSLTAPMASTGRFNWYSALLPTGDVLVAGGGNGGLHTEVYDAAADQWREASVMHAAHGSSSSLGFSQHVAVLSASPFGFEPDPTACGADCGKVLIAGNSDLVISELYLHPPGLDGIDVSTGPAAGGTTVTITGEGIADVTAVAFGGTPAASFTAIDYNTVEAVTPEHAAGPADVEVTTPAGTAVVDDGFTFVAAEHSRSVSLRLRRHLVAKGRVTAGDGFAACTQAADVLLQTKTGGGWKTVATTGADDDGRFRKRLADRAGRYRARVRRTTVGEGTDVCLGDRSPVRRHKH